MSWFGQSEPLRLAKSKQRNDRHRRLAGEPLDLSGVWNVGSSSYVRQDEENRRFHTPEEVKRFTAILDVDRSSA